jgi:hypothetical protein
VKKICANCQHEDWLHVKTYYWACGRKPRNTSDRQHLSEICPCKEFIPSDNLDYIEWLAEKKHLV